MFLPLAPAGLDFPRHRLYPLTMAYYQEMLERRRGIASRLYDIVEPRLRAVANATPDDAIPMDMQMKDLIAMTRYAMELDMEVAQLSREDDLGEEFGSDEERLAEAERLLAGVNRKRKEFGTG